MRRGNNIVTGFVIIMILGLVDVVYVGHRHGRGEKAKAEAAQAQEKQREQYEADILAAEQIRLVPVQNL